MHPNINGEYDDKFEGTWDLKQEKAEEPEIKLPTSVESLKKRVPEKHLFLLY